MKRWICNLHHSQVGLGVLATILILLLVTGGLATGTLVMMDKLGIGLVTWPWESEEEYEYTSPERFGSAYTFGCKVQGTTSTSTSSLYRIVYLEVPEDVLISSIQTQAGRGGPANDNYRWRLRIRSGGSGSGAIVGESEILYHSQFYPQGLGAQPYITAHFAEPVFLPEGALVSFWMERLQAQSSTYNIRINLERDPCSSPSWYIEGNWYRNFWAEGFTQATIRVDTGGWSQPGDGSVVLEGWCDVYGYTTTGFIWDEISANVTAGRGTEVFGGTFDPRGGAVAYFNGRAFGSRLDTQYFYRAFAEVLGVRYYGDVESFTRVSVDELPTITVAVTQNDIEGVEFTITVVGIQGGQLWDLGMVYGKTLCQVRAGASNITVTQNVTVDGPYSILLTDLDAGYRYYFKARGDEHGGTIIFSQTDSVVVYDASQPRWINWFGGWTGATGGQIWWWFAALALALVWLVAGVTRWWWLGVVLTFLLIGVLIYFGMLSPWVVVLMSLIGGWIVFKVVFKHSGSTGS